MKTVKNNNNIRIIGDIAIELKEDEIHVFKIRKHFKLNKDMKRNSFFL
jgi:hypothetical protein